MQVRGPLMMEHRLIERMLVVIRRTQAREAGTRALDPGFVDMAVDFIRMYADRTHHGKEEDILFRELGKKQLSSEHRRVMEDLLADHSYGRELTSRLSEANRRYRAGDQGALIAVTAGLRKLVDFYPPHIKKEDEIFFPAARTYFSAEEEQAMLAEFWEYDRKMIHEKYRMTVKEYASQSGNGA